MTIMTRGHSGASIDFRVDSVARAIAGAVRRGRIAREVALVLFGYFAYFLVRGFTQGSEAQAVSHAQRIVGFEKAAGFFWEPAIQRQVVDHHWIVTAANWMYIYGHWPLIACVAGWLLAKRPAAFSIFRTAFFISGAIGIIIFVTFPVAPPRLADVGVVDTVTMYSNSYRVLQPPAFVNQYAAVPSLHFGWDMLIGIALITQSPWRLVKVAGAIIPALMFGAIVLTANHYIFDAFAGGIVAFTGLAAAYAIRPRATAAQPAAAKRRALAA